MRVNIVFTLTGPDRIGIVESVTRMILAHDGNVETSRMARLGGEFAILMLISMPSEQLSAMESDVEKLIPQGYKVTTGRTGQTDAAAYRGWLPYRIEVYGADHEGIIHQIARYLSEHGINIESMETGTSRAPVSGTPLFSMTALIVVSPDPGNRNWEADLENVGRDLSVEIRVTPADE